MLVRRYSLLSGLYNPMEPPCCRDRVPPKRKEDGAQESLFTILAVRAGAVQIEPVADDPEARKLGRLLEQILGQADLEVHDLSAADADQVWVWVGLVSVIPVVVVAEAKLEHFIQVLQQGQRM
jgi:hypothetical protein